MGRHDTMKVHQPRQLSVSLTAQRAQVVNALEQRFFVDFELQSVEGRSHTSQ
jgi:hypothetical protein